MGKKVKEIWHIIKKHETLTDNPPIIIYVNKIENRITFKINAASYLELLTLKMMKLPGSTKNKIIKDKNSEIIEIKIKCLKCAPFKNYWVSTSSL